MARLDSLIGESHWGTVGEYKESILRDHLQAKLPSRYEASTGFVLSLIDNKRVLSKQLDILVWDASEYSPFYRDSHFVIIPPEACRAVIEVKATLDGASLDEALCNVQTVNRFIDLTRPGNHIHQSVFGYQRDASFPDLFFKHLHQVYGPSAAAFLDWGKKYGDRWAMPWVHEIAVLDTGVIRMIPMNVDGFEVAGFVAYRTEPGSVNDTYGVLERSLLASLLDAGRGRTLRWGHPGTASVFNVLQPDLDKVIGFTTIPATPQPIGRIGSLPTEPLADLVRCRWFPEM